MYNVDLDLNNKLLNRLEGKNDKVIGDCVFLEYTSKNINKMKRDIIKLIYSCELINLKKYKIYFGDDLKAKVIVYDYFKLKKDQLVQYDIEFI